MRLRSFPVSKKSKDNYLRNNFKGKKKQKRLDAICEQEYSRTHRSDRRIVFSQVFNGENDVELRRSNRCRKAPVVLDSSPMPPKKRRKIFPRVSNNFEKDRRGNDVFSETQPSCSRDIDGQNGDWKLRLRSRGNSRYSSRKENGKFPESGKRKLFENFDGFGDIIVHDHDNKEELAGDKSTIVKSNRPGRIKASNATIIDKQNIDLEGENENGDEKESFYYVDVRSTEVEVEDRSDDRDEVCIAVPELAEKEEDAIQSGYLGEGHDNNRNAEELGDCMQLKNQSINLLHDQRDAAEFDLDTSNQAKADECLDNTIETVSSKIPDTECKTDVPDSKLRISLGRRCSLCGGGTDGKPPKVLILEGGCSDNEAYSDSSVSEEPKYDVWDGFGDQSSWLGRLLGPINDRFGIAGIWVHQQCAVWSPEVYFSGLGCLKNVKAALYRGRMLKCSRCRRAGATIGCRVDRCPKTYHLPCARERGCIFDHRKFLIACKEHRHLFQPHGLENSQWLKKMKTKKIKLEFWKNSNIMLRKDIEAEEKLLENCGEDEEFLKRERKRLHRDLLRIAPTYLGGRKPDDEKQFQGWESVAGLEDVIQCMKEVVIMPLLYPEFFSNLGLAPPRGVLLHGYPGTGKTLVLRALVGSCSRGDTRIAYFARKGADCLGKYVGDAERQLRLLFQVAEKSQPSIIIFDEIDGLAPCRTKKQDQTHNSVVSTLLALMDGLKSRGSVIVIGTTNRPDSVDPALRRPGRFDREIYFPLPTAKDREAILSLHTQKWPRPIAGFVLKWIAKKTAGFAGADLQALCTQAVIIALRRSFPLQKVLSAAETGDRNDKRPVIPKFFVEEEDWLNALSSSPPPCSKRENGAALNDVVASPLKIHFFSCLLLPLARLLICMQLDDHVWLPGNLFKASSLVKNVIVSSLVRRREQIDRWWVHADCLLRETDVMNEIERKLLLESALVEESYAYGSDVQESADDRILKMPPSSQFMVTHQRLLQDMSHRSSKNSGFHLLICGNPRSGQRHLALCLLHCYAGNVDFQKIDLATIVHEGHGDMVHGLSRSLSGCAGKKICLLYMPRLELWAVEAENEISEHDASIEVLPGAQSELRGEPELYSTSDALGTQSQYALKEATYLWTSFLEQVTSFHVNTSLIILATSDLPFRFLPSRIREFFGCEIMNSGISGSGAYKLPRFSVQLDGKFNRDDAMHSFAAKLSKDLVQHFVHSQHVGNHVRQKPFDGKVYDVTQGDGNSAGPAKSPETISYCPLGFANKALKGKSNLQLAIATFGYQILMFPHFAELCWVTSKLKEGPCAKTDGPWKGWPFHSCIARPIRTTDKDAASAGSSIIKFKEPGLVRGLVAVGLSAYRGEYTSLRKVCYEVRNVLETLVRRIDEKILAGKNHVQFFRILAQVANLEDQVTCWAHALQSLDVDSHASEPNVNGAASSVNDGTSEPHGDGSKPVVAEINSLGKDTSDKSTSADRIRDGAHIDSANAENGFMDAGYEVAHTVVEPIHEDPLDSCCCHAGASASGNTFPAKLSNGFADSSSCLQPDGPAAGPGSDNQHFSNISPVVENRNHSSTENNIRSEEMNQKTEASTCFYQCCSECFAKLHVLLLRIMNSDCSLTIGSSSTVEDLNDILSSFAANLHLSLSRLPRGGSSLESGSGYGNCCQQVMMSWDKVLIKECCCHEISADADGERLPQLQHPRFVLKNSVLAAVDPGSGISYHCKFEKLCLCYLTDWLAMRKGVS